MYNSTLTISGIFKDEDQYNKLKELLKKKYNSILEVEYVKGKHLQIELTDIETDNQENFVKDFEDFFEDLEIKQTSTKIEDGSKESTCIYNRKYNGEWKLFYTSILIDKKGTSMSETNMYKDIDCLL